MSSALAGRLLSTALSSQSSSFFFFPQLFLVFYCYGATVNIFMQPALKAASVSEESVPRNGNQAHFLM